MKKDTTFHWTEIHERAFKDSKRLLLSNNLLEMYDPDKKIIVSCDASPYGVGAILSHEINGEQKPIIFASSTLSAAEQNYSQLHREALAIMFAINRFHKYIYGYKFELHTDHEPLQAILNPKKCKSAIAVARLQR